MQQKILLSALVLALAGCSTVTKEKINTLPQVQPQVSPTLATVASKGLKRKVAIARFSNETTAGASFFLDGKGDRVGKQATDILSARLTETQKFLLLERTDLDKIKTEAELAHITTKTVGADYLVVGSVSEFGRANTSETGIFSRNKIQTARAKVNIRLIDVKTGRIIYSEEGSGEATSEANRVFGVGTSAGYDTSLDDKALSAAISKLVSNVVERLLDNPWQAYIIGEQQGLYIITGGKSQGIRTSDMFSVVQRGAVVNNPQTGMDIELPGKSIAKLRVVTQAGENENEISLCELAEGNLKGVDLTKLVVREAN